MAEKSADTSDTGDDKGKAQDADTGDKGGHMIPKARFDEVNLKRKAAEDELKQVAEELKGDVPEDFQDLIPNLPPGELITWIRKSTAKGLFSPKAADSGPDEKRPGGPKTVDFEGMTPVEKIKAGYTT